MAGQLLADRASELSSSSWVKRYWDRVFSRYWARASAASASARRLRDCCRRAITSASKVLS